MKQQALELRNIRLSGGFWLKKTRLVADVMLPYQWKALNDQIPDAEPSHALENFRLVARGAKGQFTGTLSQNSNEAKSDETACCGLLGYPDGTISSQDETMGQFGGTIFQDSDVGKWIEAACYSMVNNPDANLEAQIEEAIRLIGASQQSDGYINTWFTLKAPDKRWTDMAWGHELYCGGHLIEAAVAHFKSTGKRHFLEIMMKYADCVLAEFSPEGPHGKDCCGHPEIELALMRLAEASGETRYARMARHFLDVRGRYPERFINQKPLGFDFPMTKSFDPDYFQGHEPLCDQHDADGHSVRAMYLFTALTQVLRISGEPELKKILDQLWESAVGRRMYVTGGIGSQANGERFTLDWDLPSDTAYTETCAAIGLIFWAREMLAADSDSRYADTIERIMYNGALSGVSLDGQSYFYVNPLETIPAVAHARHDHEHVKTERVAWFGCACCPPNIARLIASVASLAYGHTDRSLWVHQFMNSEAAVALDGTSVHVTQKTDYPWDGKIALTFIHSEPSFFDVNLRIPAWCRDFRCTVNGQEVTGSPEKGYLKIERNWTSGDCVELTLDMTARFVRPHSRIAELAGKTAVMRGPLVYCAEELDNGSDLHNLLVDPSLPVKCESTVEHTDGGITLRLSGFRETERSDALYGEWKSENAREAKPITLVPYYQWGNRKPGQEMRIWLRAIGGEKR